MMRDTGCGLAFHMYNSYMNMYRSLYMHHACMMCTLYLYSYITYMYMYMCM